MHVGEEGGAPGALAVGWTRDASVPFIPGEEFPFEDRSVARMTVGVFLAAAPLPLRVQFLLECRRVLRASGELRLPADGAAPENDRLDALARLVGLRVVHDHGNGATVCTKLDRRVSGSPLVTLAIPAYNPHFFEVAFRSALAQTYAPLEIVVCDDSADAAIEAIACGARDPRVRYLRNEARLRPRANFVRCLERATGEFVKFLCDDDVLAPTCVERLLHAFRAAPDVTLATSARRRIGVDGAALPDQPATLPLIEESAVVAGYSLANAMLMAGLNTIGEPSTALFRKADLAAAAPHYFRFRGCAGRGVIDMVTWAALLLQGNAVYLRERLSSFRVHEAQRQHDPLTRARSIASIRELQAAWLALGLHQRLAPDRLLARRFPVDDGDWMLRPITGYAALLA